MTTPAAPVPVPVPEATDRSLLRDGERVLLVDAKQRRYLITLRAGASFHTHVGIVAHDSLIGVPEGATVLGSTGRKFLVVRPTLSDIVLKMPRGAQVIYPKDLAAMVMLADVHAGVRVLEAGVGSGAMSMALLRAGADVVGYELREDFANHARSSVESALGGDVPYRVELRDVYEGIAETALDRIVLDLPEPWRVLPHAERALRSGGSSAPTCPRSTRRRSCATPWRPVPSAWPKRSRSCTGPGTWRPGPCVLITVWSGTPGSSPRPACWYRGSPGETGTRRPTGPTGPTPGPRKRSDRRPTSDRTGSTPTEPQSTEKPR